MTINLMAEPEKIPESSVRVVPLVIVHLPQSSNLKVGLGEAVFRCEPGAYRNVLKMMKMVKIKEIILTKIEPQCNQVHT